mmetsp:Transcript_19950/g.67593  ORF Transcript_19950/g.67593 Transcript_19950/m.67593 type:complete len:239 (-) Transcript_19950:623-1339(-)
MASGACRREKYGCPMASTEDRRSAGCMVRSLPSRSMACGWASRKMLSSGTGGSCDTVRHISRAFLERALRATRAPGTHGRCASPCRKTRPCRSRASSGRPTRRPSTCWASSSPCTRPTACPPWMPWGTRTSRACTLRRPSPPRRRFPRTSSSSRATPRARWCCARSCFARSVTTTPPLPPSPCRGAERTRPSRPRATLWAGAGGRTATPRTRPRVTPPRCRAPRRSPPPGPRPRTRMM